MKINPIMVIVIILLLGASVTATVGENCRVVKNDKCANGSTIALTVVLSLLVAVTSIYWVRPVFLPTPVSA